MVGFLSCIWLRTAESEDTCLLHIRVGMGSVWWCLSVRCLESGRKEAIDDCSARCPWGPAACRPLAALLVPALGTSCTSREIGFSG